MSERKTEEDWLMPMEWVVYKLIGKLQPHVLFSISSYFSHLILPQKQISSKLQPLHFSSQILCLFTRWKNIPSFLATFVYKYFDPGATWHQNSYRQVHDYMGVFEIILKRAKILSNN